MESHESSPVEGTPTAASDSFLSRLHENILNRPDYKILSTIFGGTKTAAASTGVFGLMAASQAVEGGTSGIVGASMLGILTAEMAGITVINAVRDRKANKQQKT